MQDQDWPDDTVPFVVRSFTRHLNLRVFGSNAFVNILQEKRRKLNAKSKNDVFVGYNDYRIWFSHERKSEISRDVIIREENWEAVIQHKDEVNKGPHIYVQTEGEKSEAVIKYEYSSDLKDDQSHDANTKDEQFVRRYNTRSRGKGKVMQIFTLGI